VPVAEGAIGCGLALKTQSASVVRVLVPGGAGAAAVHPGLLHPRVVLVVPPCVARAVARPGRAAVFVRQVEARVRDAAVFAGTGGRQVAVGLIGIAGNGATLKLLAQTTRQWKLRLI
jgi:hypothetical protein